MNLLRFFTDHHPCPHSMHPKMKATDQMKLLESESYTYLGLLLQLSCTRPQSVTSRLEKDGEPGACALLESH